MSNFLGLILGATILSVGLLGANTSDAAIQQYKYYYDADGDGWGTSAQQKITSSPLEPLGWSARYGDINDTNIAFRPDIGSNMNPLPPQFVDPITHYTLFAGQTLQFMLGVTDPDDQNAQITIQMEGYPSGSLFDGARFSWETSDTDVGTYYLRFFAVDGSGFGTLNATVDVLAAEVPEPATVTLLFAALGMLGAASRRHRV